MKQKVHPLDFESIDGYVQQRGRDIEEASERPMDEVDLLVQDIEGDLDALTGQLSGRYSEGPRRLGIVERGVTQRKRSAGLADNRRSYRTSRDDDNYKYRSGRNDDEVKMSHELVDPHDDGSADRDSLMKLLLDQQYTLMEQVVEYRKMSDAIRDKLKEADGKVGTLETRIDELEDENYELKSISRTSNDGKKGAPASTSRPRSVQSKLNSDLNNRSQQLRKALLVDDGDQDGSILLTSSEATKHKSFLQATKDLLSSYMPFQKNLRFIQANYGSSTASYFSFLRMTMIQMMLIGATMTFFSVIHLALLFSQGSSLTGVITSPGLLPGFMLLSSFGEHEAFTYSSFLIFTLLGLLLGLVAKLMQEHKWMVLMAEVASERKATYSKEVLSAWDFSAHTPSAIDELSSTLKTNFLQLMEETRAQGRQRARSNYEAFEVTARRVAGLMLYVMLIGLSFAAIIAVTIKNSDISNNIAQNSFFKPFKTLVKPICLNFINILVPQLIYLINNVEGWDSAKTELQVILLRVYLSNTLNTVIVAASYLMLLDPFLFATEGAATLRSNAEVPLDSAYSCRADQAADGLFVLVAGTFVSKLANFVSTPTFNYLYARVTKTPWKKSEVDIAILMVDKLSFCGLIFLSFPFAPLSAIFAPIYFLLMFKYEEYFLKRLYTKPLRPFGGQSTGLLFSSLYLLTFCVLGLTVGLYVASTHTMAKACDIQDYHVGLCSDSVDSTTNECSTDSRSKYYSVYGQGGAYPAAICTSSCGPFMHRRSIAAVLIDGINSQDGLSKVWAALFVYPYLPWTLVIVLLVRNFMLHNSLHVSMLAASSKDRMFEAQVQASELERKRQEQIIVKLKSIEDLSSNMVVPSS